MNWLLEASLSQIGLRSLVEKFYEEKLDFQTQLAASDQELTRLGVVRMGDKVHLRQLYQQEQQKSESQNRPYLNSDRPNNGPSTSSTNESSLWMETEIRGYPDVVRERSFLFRSGNSSLARSTSRWRNSQTGPTRARPRNNIKTIPRPWTVKFFCLSNKYSSKIPTTSEREILENACLG